MAIDLPPNIPQEEYSAYESPAQIHGPVLGYEAPSEEFKPYRGTISPFAELLDRADKKLGLHPVLPATSSVAQKVADPKSIHPFSRDSLATEQKPKLSGLHGKLMGKVVPYHATSDELLHAEVQSMFNGLVKDDSLEALALTDDFLRLMDEPTRQGAQLQMIGSYNGKPSGGYQTRGR